MRHAIVFAIVAACLGGCVAVENAPERIQVRVPNFNIPVLGDSEDGVSLIAYDDLAEPGQRVRLVAEMMSVRKNFPVENILVRFRHDGQTLAEGLTDADGLAEGFWTPPGEGDYRIEAEIVDVARRRQEELLDLPPSDMVLSVRQATTPFIVVDLDRTLVGSNFFRVMIDRAQPMAHSQAVMQRLAKDYSVIYLTHRPLHFTPLSREWLDRHGYPAGPLLSSTIDEFMEGSGAYKTSRLADIRKTFRNLKIGIGDKASDVLAYQTSGMEAYWIPHLDDDVDDRIKEAREIAAVTEENIYCVDSWLEIREGIYGGRRISPQEFARRVREQAEKELRHPWRRDDDDSDDDLPLPPPATDDEDNKEPGWV